MAHFLRFNKKCYIRVKDYLPPEILSTRPLKIHGPIL